MEFPFQVEVFANFNDKQAHIYITSVEKEKFQGISCATSCFLLGVVQKSTE